MSQSTESRLLPQWLAHRYDPAHDSVHLIDVPRAVRAEVPFLIDAHLASAGSPVVARRAEVLAQCGTPAPVHFIFHSAYCCSTLLANAYDRPGTSFSLKEPAILNDLVGWRHRGADADQLAARMCDSVTLLARPFAPGEVAVIKPSNVVSGLIEALLRVAPQAKALLLYAPLEVYLASIANKGLWGRRWVRDLYLKLHRDGLTDLGIDADEMFMLTDLQVAAAGWLAQHRLFGRIAGAAPQRIRTLDSEALTARPLDYVAALDRHFGIATDEGSRAAMITRVFGTHAKFGTAFSPEERIRAREAAVRAHQDEVEKVHGWALAVAEANAIAMTPPSPL